VPVLAIAIATEGVVVAVDEAVQINNEEVG